VGDIPQEPSAFRRRPDLLAELDRPGAAGPSIRVITGMPGVGKTQLAAECARARAAAGWRLVAWVHAEDKGAVLTGLAAVTDAAGLTEGGTGRYAGDPGLVLRHRLETDGDRCLLVFDNATDPDVLRPFVPADGAACVLVTTDRQPVAILGASVPVDVFTPQDAVAFLADQTGMADSGGSTLAAELGYLPLALAQAGAVIAQQRLGYRAYLSRLQALPAEGGVSQGEDQGEDQGEEEPRPNATSAAVLLSLDAIRRGDRPDLCIGLLEIMAVLSAAGVRRDLLLAAGRAGVLTRGGHRVTADLVDRALAQLARSSLLTVSLDGQTIVAHCLVTRVLRHELAHQGHLTAVCRAAVSVLETRAQALVGSPDRPAVRDIPTQVTSLLRNIAGPVGEADPERERVLLRLRLFAVHHLIELGDSASQVIAVGEPLIADLERLLGPDHPDTLTSRHNLASAYQAVGRTAEAIPLFEQALFGRERLLGPDHPDTLTSRHDLASAYQAVGRTAEAILLLRLTLAARERLLGADHLDTVESCKNLAAAYREAGRVAEAIPLLERTAEAWERLLGADDPSALGSRNNLAAAYREAGRVADAIPLLEQTVATCERRLGPDHPHTLTSRGNLAVAYRDAGRVSEAIPLFEQTLAGRERVLGPDHPHTVTTRSNLDLAYAEAGRT
jgi:tetratricopeptide (TPR) repeat protein